MTLKLFYKTKVTFFSIFFIFFIILLSVNSFYTKQLLGFHNTPPANYLANSSDKPIVMFDEAHSPSFCINASDPVPGIIPGYAYLADRLLTHGFLVETFDVGGTISRPALDACDVFVIVDSFDSYTTIEIAALYSWVTNGGSLLLISDYGPAFSTITSTIALEFGYTLGQDMLKETDDYNIEESWFVFTDDNIQDHDITQSLSRFESYASDGILKSPIGSQALVTTDFDGTAYWSNQAVDAINVSILSINEKWNSTLGKFALLTDTNIFDNLSDSDGDGDFNGKDSDNEHLALSLFYWLADVQTAIAPTKGTYFSFVIVFGLFIYVVSYRRKH
ncbi:MAG: hypothetical protein ACTSXA_07460 [Candidatus Heimdallarchaeota archaeon]